MAKNSGGGSAPKGGIQPKQKAAAKPAAKIGKIVKGAPSKGGGGSDKNPYSSARKG